MKFLLNQIKKSDHLFQKGGKLEKLHPLWDAQNTFLFTPGEVTTKGTHIRDSIDLKRLMITVVVALIPCTLMAFYNTGFQTARAYGEEDVLTHWQLFANGAMVCLPIIITSYAVGGLWEGLFAVVRRHKISEGFLVTGLLFPLTLPPTIPLWQVAIGVSFGVVIGKEIFGGTGMNILNPALTARVFLFFSFPKQISGPKVWIYTIDPTNWFDNLLFHNASRTLPDTFTGATALLAATSVETGDVPSALVNQPFVDFSFMDLFIGLVPGSIGETSALACLIGAVILIATGVGSWRIMVGTIAGGLVMPIIITWLAPMLVDDPTPFTQMPFYWHLVMGGFLFGTVYMATDPVSAAGTETGKYIYGFLIGVLCVLIRVVNPAYPEGMMLAILFMNIFAPLIDHYVVQSNIKRRLARETK